MEFWNTFYMVREVILFVAIDNGQGVIESNSNCDLLRDCHGGCWVWGKYGVQGSSVVGVLY